ncbi:MAG: hypothetical protein WCA59_04010 [Candidatus Binataceae bacterium]
MRAYAAMTARRHKETARFVMGERAEVYHCVRDGMVGVSRDSSRK